LGFYLNKTPKIIRPLAKDLIWSFPGKTSTLYLTFDDGPIPNVTPAVLAILDEFNAKATFFCVGENVKKHPDIYKMILEKGHSVGNHTYNHLSGWKSDNNEYKENILEAENYITSSLFRPPYGKITRSQIKLLKSDYKIVMWDVLSGDFDTSTSPEKCANNVIKNASEGSIIVFHDSIKAEKTMLKSLPLVLEHFAKLHFEFCSIPMA